MGELATPEKTDAITEANVQEKALRSRIMKKVTEQGRVDIKDLGRGRYRVNVWKETGQASDGGLFRDVRITQSFYHID